MTFDTMDPTKAALLTYGMGLMGTRGPQAFGRAGLMALDAHTNARKMQAAAEEAAAAKQMRELQMKQLQAAITKAEKDAKIRDELLGGLSGPPAVPPAGPGPMTEETAATPDGQRRLQMLAGQHAQYQQTGGVKPLPYDLVRKAQIAGVADLLDLYKTEQQGFKMEPGATYRMPGQPDFVAPNYEKGFRVENGSVVPIPGAAETAAGMARAVKGAEAQEAAKWQPVTGYQGGAPGLMPGMSVADVIGAGRQAPPSAPAAAPQPAGAAFGTERGQPFIPTGPSAAERVQEVGDTEAVKVDMQNLAAYNKGSFAANNKIANLGLLRNLLRDHDGGKLSPLGVDIASAAKSFGLNIDPKLPNKEAAQMIINPMALALRNTGEGAGMPGAMSDKDREFLLASAPSLTTSKRGREIAIDMMIRLERRTQEVARMANQWRSKHGSLGKPDQRTGLNFYDSLGAWADANPLFADIKLD